MIIPVGFSQVNLLFGGTAVPLGAQMTFGVENTTDADPATIAALVDAAYNTAEVYKSQSTSCGLTGILVKNGPNATGASAQIAVSRTGSYAQPALPPNVSVLVRKFTAVGGRKGRGRMFFPAFVEGQVTEGGVIAPAEMTPLQTRFAAFRTGMRTAGIPPFLLHSGTGGFADLPNEITGFTVENKVATQRRRLRR